MKQLTLRGFDLELEQRLQHIAETENTSLNKTVLKLLHQATGLKPKVFVKPVIGDSLTPFLGLWTDEEADQFNSDIKYLDTVDDELWR